MSMKMMCIICYGLHSHQVSTQLNTYGRVWNDSAIHHHHQNTKWFFWKNGVHPSSRVQRLGESMPKRIEAVLEAQHLTKTLCFAFHLSPICIFLSWKPLHGQDPPAVCVKELSKHPNSYIHTGNCFSVPSFWSFSNNCHFVIPLQEFFTEDLWHTLPNAWQPVLQDLTYPQIADLLLDATHGDRRYYWIVISRAAVISQLIDYLIDRKLIGNYC